MLDKNNFIAIGKIVKQVGIKGNLKIISLTDFPERFNKQKKVFLFNEKENKFLINNYSDNFAFVISECKFYGKHILLKFENYNTINRSKILVDSIIMVNEKDRTELKENNFYYYELIGMSVFNKNEMIGKVISINNYGSDDLFIIKSDKKEIFIPFRKEFIKDINIENKRIDVDLIEGFLEK